MTKKRNLVLVLCLVLVTALVSVGGTLAWLTASTSEVKNTFSPTTIKIGLAESENLDLVMVPGKTITKDPKVTVEANSEACWLFVKIEKSTNFDNFMTYTVADGWTALPGVDNVYYRSVAASSADQVFEVIANNTVTVKEGVTKAMMDALTAETYPTLTFTAYASQSANVADVNTAWQNISNPTASTEATGE